MLSLKQSLCLLSLLECQIVAMGGAAVVSEGRVEVVAAAVAESDTQAVAAVVTCVLVVLCCVLGARYLRQRHQYWQRRGVPCPPATPLLGHTLARMGLTRPFTEVRTLQP